LLAVCIGLPLILFVLVEIEKSIRRNRKELPIHIKEMPPIGA
jgi:hypothetical protein